MSARGDTPMGLRPVVDRILSDVARSATGREVRVRLGDHQVDFILERIEVAAASWWADPLTPDQVADEMMGMAFELGEIVQRNLFDPWSFGLDAATAIGDSVDRWTRTGPGNGPGELPLAETAAVVARKMAGGGLPSAVVTGACSVVRLTPSAERSNSFDVTFDDVVVTAAVDEQELPGWLRRAGVELPRWAALDIGADGDVLLRHRKTDWLPRLALSTRVVGDEVVIALDRMMVAGRMVKLPRSRRRHWTLAGSTLGSSLRPRCIRTIDGELVIEAAQRSWTRSITFEQLEKLSFELAADGLERLVITLTNAGRLDQVGDQ